MLLGPRVSAINDANVLRYAGCAYDARSGLYCLSKRYYDPTTAQFLAKDPAKADGEESPYRYCGGDPVGKVDPSGEEPRGPGMPDGYPRPHDARSATEARVRDAALKWVNKKIPYCWGGVYFRNSQEYSERHTGMRRGRRGWYAPEGTMDCSWFIRCVFKDAGIPLPMARPTSRSLYAQAPVKSQSPNEMYFDARGLKVYHVGDLLMNPGEHVVLVISCGANPEIAECTPTGGRSDGTKRWTLYRRRGSLAHRPGSWRPKRAARWF